MVIGETPYAEWLGDDADLALDPADVACLSRIGDIPTVVVLVSGRPLMVADRIGNWDAFVAAWLPGTEGDGVAQVLFGDHNFSGVLPHSWPVSIGQVPINAGDSGGIPLYPYGFGLTYPSLPPTTTITSPGDGAFLPAGDLQIEAEAIDTDGTVSMVFFYEGERLLGVDATAPYSVTWPAAADGCYTISARAVDDSGLTGTHAIEITVGNGCDGQAPFGGAPAAIPGVIQAEDFDLGGEGIAYHDTTPGNNGNAYRDENVDLEPSSEQGFNVGWIDAGEWLEYTVDVATPGLYTLEARVASDADGGAFRIESAGTDLTGTITAPRTGGWQNWTTVRADLVLDAGVQRLRVAMLESLGGFNINSLTFIRGCPADLASPFGVLDLNDINAFVGAFVNSEPIADLNGDGVFDLADIAGFVDAFVTGCT